jgi:hypothetical protein
LINTLLGKFLVLFVVLGEVVVVAGRGECTGDTENDDLLALEGVGAQNLGDSAGVLQFGVIWAKKGRWRVYCRVRGRKEGMEDVR